MNKLTFIVFLTSLFFMGCKKTEAPAQTNKNIISSAGLVIDSLWESPQNAIHIDPTISDNNANGTIEHPFSSFEKIKWQDGLVVALKRGTEIKTESIVIDVNNFVFASYGLGSRPIINYTGDGHAITTDWKGNAVNVTIRDVEINASKAASCIIFRDNDSNVKIINCKLYGAQWGIRALNYVKKIYIYNTEVFNTYDDGIFIKSSEDIEIANCYVHNVNLNWKPPTTSESDAGGDGIQFEACNHWWVHNNKIDHSSTGNKFCFISNNNSQNDGICEYNYMIGPKVDGASIYLGGGEGLIIRYNYITAPSNSPVYTHLKSLKVYYNIFDGITGPLYADNAEVYNNLFYNMQKLAIQGDSIIARNNIFDLSSPDNYRFHVNHLTEDHNLFVYGLPTDRSFTAYPLYIDAKLNNFHLQKNSPCIDKGIDVGLNKDYDGNKVPEGQIPDIGPYEYIQ